MGEVTLESQLIEIIKDEEMVENIKLAKVDMLVRLGVDVNALYGAKSALKLANEVNEREIAKMLKDNEARDFIDEEKVNELGEKLCEICTREYVNINIDEINELIDMGADVHQKDEEGWTDLMNASYRGHKEIVELLIEKGADVNAEDDYGCTALMVASRSGHKEVVEFLIEKGADVNQKDNDGDTALKGASYWGCKEVVGLLIEKGADVNDKTNDGSTALMGASFMGCKEIVELLIQNGADVNQKNNYGQNAMMRADNEEIKKAIIEAVKKRNEKTGENVVVQGIERE